VIDDDASDASLAEVLRFLMQPEPWMDYAACKGVGPKAFFPERGQSTKEGYAYCARCPVTGPCGEYAQRSGSEFGIWGGYLHSRGQMISDPKSRTDPDGIVDAGDDTPDPADLELQSRIGKP
jgi:WhiB family transcriptional regulator, redox-sensing transcriptional regulator